MASGPAFSATPRIGTAALSAANTNRDGTGTIVDVLTGVAAGTRIEEVLIEATATTTAGVIRLFLYNGTTSVLFDEILVSAATPSGTVAAFRASRQYANLVLPSASWKLQAATNNAETFNVIAYGGDL